MYAPFAAPYLCTIKKSQMKKPLISGGMAVLLFFLSAIALLLIVKYVIL